MQAFRLVVAGCRNYTDYATAEREISSYLLQLNPTSPITIVCGDAKGADRLGERYALEHHLSVEHFPADWEHYGKSAGPIRNKEMSKVADAVIAFWDGESKGTQNMIECARQSKIPCRVIRIEQRRESHM